MLLYELGADRERLTLLLLLYAVSSPSAPGMSMVLTM